MNSRHLGALRLKADIKTVGKVNEGSNDKDDRPKSIQNGEVIVDGNKVDIEKKVDIGLVFFLAMWLVLGVVRVMPRYKRRSCLA